MIQIIKLFTAFQSSALTSTGILLSSLMMAQPTILWQKSMGGSEGDIAHAVTKTHEGGVLVAGGTYSFNADVIGNHGAGDVWLVKLSASGEVLATKALGGSSSEHATDIQQTPDGGYILCGISNSNDGDATETFGLDDYWVVKLDGDLNIEWQKTLGGLSHDRARSVAVTADGGYIVAGQGSGSIGFGTGWDFWIIKLSGTGAVEWQKALGGTNDDLAWAVITTSDGGYMVGGYSTSSDGDVTHHLSTVNTPDYWIVKLDSNGNIQWEKAIGGTSTDYLYDIIQTTDNGYIMIGRSLSTDGDVTSHHQNSYGDAWVVKVDATGNIEWNRGLGGYYGEIGRAIIQTSDGNYACAIEADSDDGDLTANYGPPDSWIVKLSTTGSIIWQRNFGSSSEELTNDICEMANGNLVFVGLSTDVGNDVTTNLGGEDFWVVAVDQSVNITENSHTEIDVYPNPTADRCIIKTSATGHHPYTLLDISGKIIDSGNFAGLVLNLDLSNLASGLYFFRTEGSTVPISKN